MRVSTWLIGVFALAWGAAGCGKAEGGSSPIARQDLAAQVAKVVCDGFGSCCQEQDHPFDAKACQSGFVQELEEEWSHYLGTTVYDAAAAGRCLGYFRDNARCGVASDDHVDPACLRIFVGHAKPGQACNETVDCEEPATGNVYCGHDSATQGSEAPGVCVTEQVTVSPHGKLGEACFSSCDESDCVAGPAPAPGVPEGGSALCYRSDGLYCAAGQCAELVALGGACSGSEACAGDTYCAAGVCSARQPDGAACALDTACQSSECSNGVCGPFLPSAEACASGSPFQRSTD